MNPALKNYSVEIILDSLNPYNGVRLTTMKLLLPRFILAQFNTHRVFSSNTSSSRAIPIHKVIEQVKNNPAMPLVWGSNKAGMQAGDELDYFEQEASKVYWDGALKAAINYAEHLNISGLHKQHVNRILEPFQLIEVLVTATEWDNFFELRCHEDAQPEIHHLACLMRDAMFYSTPIEREMHIPFISDGFAKPVERSVARCARVSYTLRDGTTSIEKDLELYDRLVGSEPLHASPAEHQAIALESDEFCRNFRGWKQHRVFLEEKK
mgnify:FL=1